MLTRLVFPTLLALILFHGGVLAAPANDRAERKQLAKEAIDAEYWVEAEDLLSKLFRESPTDRLSYALYYVNRQLYYMNRQPSKEREAIYYALKVISPKSTLCEKRRNSAEAYLNYVRVNLENAGKSSITFSNNNEASLNPRTKAARENKRRELQGIIDQALKEINVTFPSLEELNKSAQMKAQKTPAEISEAMRCWAIGECSIEGNKIINGTELSEDPIPLIQ